MNQVYLRLASAGVGSVIVPDIPSVHTNKISVVRIREKIGYKSVYMVWNE